MEESKFYVGGHEVIIGRIYRNEYFVYFKDCDYSIRGTLPEVFEAIVDEYGDCINDITYDK